MHALTRSLAPPTTEHRWLAAQLDINHLLLDSPEGHALLPSILEAIVRHVPVERATLLLASADGQLETPLHAPRPLDGRTEFAFAPVADAIHVRVAQTGKPLVVEHLSREPTPGGIPLARAVGAPEASCVCVPLLFSKRCLGAVAVEVDYDKARDIELFVRNLRLVAGLITQTLRATRGLREDVSAAVPAPLETANTAAAGVGNVRPFEPSLERAAPASVPMFDGDVGAGVSADTVLPPASANATAPRTSLSEAVETFEKNLLVDSLKSTGGNCARAARLLDTTERIFHYKIRKYEIDPRRFKT